MQSGGDYSNGFHGELDRVEEKQLPGLSSFGRAKRRSTRGGAHDPRGGLTNGFMVSDQLGEQNPLETQKSPPPCTDFDVAYFHSYAHVGIHEEMIKVLSFAYSLTARALKLKVRIEFSLVLGKFGSKKTTSNVADIFVQMY